MTRTQRRKYAEKEKQKIAADGVRLGVNEAAQMHEVHRSNVYRWVKKYGESSSAGKAKKEDKKSAQEKRKEAEDNKNKEERTERKSRKTSVGRRYTPSEKAQTLEYAGTHGVSAASTKFGVSRFSIYAWKQGVSRAARGEGNSPTSGPAPQDIEAQRDAEILAEWGANPGLGPSQIRNQLRRKQIKVSVNTVRSVMLDHGYRPPRVKQTRHDKRYEAVRPNHLWHLDFMHRYVNRQKTFTLLLLDDYSRFVTGHGVTDAERADVVITTFEEAVERYGRPEMVMHDKGSAFWTWRGISRFTSLLTEMGIDQVVAEHKEWNGKIEVFNGNLQKELFEPYRFADVVEMKKRLASHLYWYNHQRTHHALGGLLVPADRYYGRVAEVLARIEAGAGRDGLDSLHLGERELELFKVTSTGGTTTLWLMGHPLLSSPK